MEKKGYYAIIPADVRYSKELPANAKLLYGEITALSNEKGYCWASNKYFADLYEVSETSVSHWIQALKENGFIKSVVNLSDGNTRKITLQTSVRKVKDPLEKKFKTSVRKVKDPLEKKFKTSVRKVQENNTVNTKTNITVNNINNNSELSSQVKEIMQVFYEINPTLNWGNKTTRKACEDLIERFGLDETVRMARAVVSLHGVPYAPQASTPYEMKEKLAKFKGYFESERRKQEKNKFSNVPSI